MLEMKPKAMIAAPRPQAVAEKTQPRRLLLALVLLIIALGAVVIRDRQFWFGGDETQEADASETQPMHAAAKPVQKVATPAAAIPVKKQTAKTAAESKPADTRATDAPAVATTRTVLPPLDVEVVAGDSHRKIHPGSNTTKLEITGPVPTSAAEREALPATSAHANVTSDATYPLLAQQMKVQGSVVLQALIGADGIIENLKVVSGPAILSSAAQQAVREWKFKPIIENGTAVESKARITVNFTINIADGSGKTTIAESRPLTISRLDR